LRCDNEWIYVSDSANNQVDKFTLSGNYLLSMGSRGTGPDQFVDGGRELTLGLDGNVYAPDMGGSKTNVYSPQGVHLFSFPSPPEGPPNGGFNWPFDVEVDTARNAVYVADTFNHRVQKFTLNGNYVDQWGERGDDVPFGMNYPRGIAVDHASGNVFLSNTRQGNVKVYNQNGNFLRQFGTFGGGTSQFRYARGLWVSDNRMWIGDSGNLRLKATTLFGATQLTPDCGAEYSDLSHEGCTDAIRGLDGRLYVASPSDNQIYVFNYNNGNLITTFGAAQLRGPVGIAQTPDGTLWITELDTNRLSAYSTNGQFLGTFGSFGSGNNQFNQPTGIAADTNGNIYVADRLNERIQVFSTTGGGGGPDTTPPNGTVDVPTPNQVFGAGTITLEGDATDNVGVAQVRVAIRNVTTQQWWTGTGWGGWTSFAGRPRLAGCQRHYVVVRLDPTGQRTVRRVDPLRRHQRKPRPNQTLGPLLRQLIAGLSDHIGPETHDVSRGRIGSGGSATGSSRCLSSASEHPILKEHDGRGSWTPRPHPAAAGRVL
jgi:DNA-binding beta-propeller fold protein YncE